MSIVAIISQPGQLDLKAAYRPVVLVVRATRTDGNQRPPVVYCDIYVNGVFYKSHEKTQYAIMNAGSTDWQFDIQDALQEVLRSKIGVNGNNQITAIPSAMTKVFCRFRSSGFNAEGFITGEGTAPVQATGSAAAMSGDGVESNSFYVANSTLQHEQNQLLPVHLNAYKTGTWQGTAFPLSHRRNGYKVGLSDSDVFPIINLGEKKMQCLVLNYKNKGQSTFFKMTNCSVIVNPGMPFDAVDDIYSCYKNYWLNIPAPGLKANDIDEDLPSCIITADEFDTAHGHVKINANGSFSYTPVDNYTGPDTFSYILTNQYGMTDAGTVTINVKEMETGMMVVWPGPIDMIPAGWYLIDGSEKNIADDPGLFALFGTTHGGDGTTTFNLPPWGGKNFSVYDATKADYNAVGKLGGANTKAIGVTNLPPHSFNLFGNASGSKDPGANDTVAWSSSEANGNQDYDMCKVGGTPNKGKTNTIGNGTPFDVRSEFVAVPWIIKR